jgi:hypothetical protein
MDASGSGVNGYISLCIFLEKRNNSPVFSEDG